MRDRVDEEVGRGETNTNQTSAIVIVIFIECLLSEGHCAQHFTGTNSFSSHNCPELYIYYPSVMDEEVEAQSSVPCPKSRSL